MKSLDIFGSKILLRFKGEDTYNTKFGSIVTCMIIGIIMFRLVFIIKDVFQRTSPQVIYNERQVNDPKKFEITRESFPFAFSLQDSNSVHYIDESIYTIYAEQQTKKLVFNDNTGSYDPVWKKTSHKLIPCTKNNFGNLDNVDYFLNLKLSNFYCFPPDVVLEIEGDFNSQTFSQIRLTVKKCTGVNCKDPSIVDAALERTIFAINMSDNIVDPKSKENPFKGFARNLFWPASLKLPKEVNIFLKNNYITSDYGWFLEDFQTEDLPSFSSTDLAVYPPSFQQYFFQVTIRFEKQKESLYQRKYKNFNSIISEIGGFTQSLLAIGFLICSKLSTLQLNQEIINQAFNYEESNENDNKQQMDQNENVQNNNSYIQQNISGNQNPKDHKYLDPPSIFENKINNLDASQNRFVISPRNNSMNQQTKNNPDETNLNYIGIDQNNINNQYTDRLNVSHFQLNSPSNQYSQHSSVMQSNLNNSQPNNTMNKLQFQQANNNTINNNENNQNVSSKNNNNNDIKLDKQQSNIQDQSIQLIDILVKNQNLVNQRKKNRQNQNISYKGELQIKKLQEKIHQKEQQIHEIRFKQLMQKQTKSMKLSIFEYLKSILWPFGKLKEKKTIINYSIDRLYKNLDIFNIIKKLQEVEKLKLLLFDHDQIKLFEYLPKPTIRSDLLLNNVNFMGDHNNGNQFDFLYNDDRNEIEKVRDAFLSYQSIMKKPKISQLDQKIIAQIDPNLIGIFSSQYSNYQKAVEESQQNIDNNQNQLFFAQTPKILQSQQQQPEQKKISKFNFQDPVLESSKTNDIEFVQSLDLGSKKDGGSGGGDKSPSKQQILKEEQNNNNYQNQEILKESLPLNQHTLKESLVMNSKNENAQNSQSNQKDGFPLIKFIDNESSTIDNHRNKIMEQQKQQFENENHKEDNNDEEQENIHEPDDISHYNIPNNAFISIIQQNNQFQDH